MKDFKEIFGIALGLLLKMLEVLMGASIFVIAMKGQELTLVENLLFYMYLVFECFLNLIPCYFGGEIYTTSDNFVNDIFSSEWSEADRIYKKSMIIFIENLKEPVKLSFAGFPNLNLQKFQEVK